jgi:hypothetical protein
VYSPFIALIAFWPYACAKPRPIAGILAGLLQRKRRENEKSIARATSPIQ